MEENTVIEKQYKMETSAHKIKGLFYQNNIYNTELKDPHSIRNV